MLRVRPCPVSTKKHSGDTTFENLALACPFCNRAKGSDLESIDPDTGQLTPFFNPRIQDWGDHFRLDGPRSSHEVQSDG